MTRSTTMVEVTERLQERLAELLPVFADRIFLTVTGDPPTAALRDHECITLQWIGGQYDYARQIGAGRKGVAYQATVRIVIWVADEADETGRDESLMLTSPVALFRVQHGLLKLVDDELNDGDVLDGIVEGGIKALSDEAPNRTTPDPAVGAFTSGSRGVLGMTFGIDLVWDLDQNTDDALLRRPEFPLNI